MSVNTQKLYDYSLERKKKLHREVLSRGIVREPLAHAVRKAHNGKQHEQMHRAWSDRLYSTKGVKEI